MVEDFTIPSKLEFCSLKKNTFTTLYFFLHLRLVSSHYTPCYYFLIMVILAIILAAASHYVFLKGS